MLTEGELSPIYICGSTATGKTGVSISLANLLDGEIINGDAYQIYKGLDIITAAPSADEQVQAPHHLFGIIEPTQDFDAKQYLDLVTPTIESIQARGKTPIIVGGSGMYLKCLTHGLSPVPAGDDSLREELELLEDKELVAKLEQLDPIGATQTNLENRRFVIRALEICILSGKPMSQLKTSWANISAEKEKHLRGFVLDWDRDTLRERIALRTKMMIQQGAIDEVKSHSSLSNTCEKAIGVRDIRRHLNNEITLERCEELIYFATCQYAKRQRTWFKREQWLTHIPTDASMNGSDLANVISGQL